MHMERVLADDGAGPDMPRQMVSGGEVIGRLNQDLDDLEGSPATWHGQPADRSSR
jgi:hypothetical protein